MNRAALAVLLLAGACASAARADDMDPARLYLRGERAEALSYAPRRDPRDLFWAYPAERARNGEHELSELRDEASP